MKEKLASVLFNPLRIWVTVLQLSISLTISVSCKGMTESFVCVF